MTAGGVLTHVQVDGLGRVHVELSTEYPREEDEEEDDDEDEDEWEEEDDDDDDE
jgi:hypothetical protein